MLRADPRPAAPEPDGGDVRLESPHDVRFALNALLGTDSRGSGPGEEACAAILGRLRAAPTVVELVDAVFAWRRSRCAEEWEKAEEAARRRRALHLLLAYFLLDPAVPGDSGALAS